MDFNGNVCTGQCGQTEVPWSAGVADGYRKNCCRLNEEKNGSRMSSESFESANSRDFPRNRPRDPEYRKPARQSGNYAEMCEHERGGGNPCEGTELNLNDVNVWPSGSCDPCCDNFDDAYDAALLGMNWNDNVCANCTAGVNLGPQRAACEKKCDENAKHNVSFKRCYESINQMWSKKRRKRTNPDSALKETSKERKVKEPNHRCTFENCYGNCDTYIVDLSGSDCDQCQNCRNPDFDSTNTYIEDCCCSREPKPCSSNVSVHSVRRVHRVCANCTEPVKCCSPREPKCDVCASSKHCLQRVHFVKPRPSCCSFCSRKCSPSRASLFVEIGSSVADLRCLRSGQVFRLCNDSSESFRDGLARRESDPVKRNKSDLLKTRSKPKKRADASERKCSPNCRTRPAAMGRSFSDKIECPEIDCIAIEKGKDKGARKRKSAHKLSDCSLRQRFSHKASTVCFDTKKTDCWQQCESYERSMWQEIRKGRLWLQDSCKSFLKTAATSINQLVKQTSKGKLFKKSTRKPDKGQACDHAAVCPNEVCWTEMVTNGSTNCNANCCQNACCSVNEDPNTTGVLQCQKCDHYNYCQTARDSSQHVDPADKDLSDDRQRCTGYGVRERGGSDSYGGSQRKRNSGYKDTSSTSSSYRAAGTSRNQSTQRNPSADANRGRIRQGQPPVITTIDSTIQTSVTQSVLDPTTTTQRSIAYQRRVVQVRQMDPASYNGQEGRPSPRQYSRSLPPARSSSRTREGPATRDPTATSRKSGVTTAESEVQCEIITQSEVVCSPSGTETATQVGVSCVCSPGAGETKRTVDDTDEVVAAGPTYEDISTEAVKGSEIDFPADTIESPRAESTLIGSETDDAEATPDETTDDSQHETVEEVVPDEPDEPDETEVETTEGEELDTTDDSAVETPVDATEAPDDSAAETPVDTAEVSDDSAVEIPVDDSAEETPADTADVPDDSAEETPVDTAEVPDDSVAIAPVDDAEVPGDSQVVPAEEAEDSAIAATVLTDEVSLATELATTAVDDASKREATISRVTKEGRSVASIHMQTSSTILTKILSEFQIGNTKKRILMSIKLQTARDTDAASFSSDSNATESTQVNETKKHTKLRSNPALGGPKKTKRPATSKSTNSRSSKPKEAIDQGHNTITACSQKGVQSRRSRSEWSTIQGTMGFCAGPCGREKPMK